MKGWGPPGVLILRIVCGDPHPPTCNSVYSSSGFPTPGLVPTATSAHESLLLSIAILCLCPSRQGQGQCLACDLTSLMGPRRVAGFQFVLLCCLFLEWTGDLQDPCMPSQKGKGLLFTGTGHPACVRTGSPGLLRLSQGLCPRCLRFSRPPVFRCLPDSEPRSLALWWPHLDFLTACACHSQLFSHSG